MHLLVIRHAIAADRAGTGSRGQSDALRPLTGEGRRKMADGALGLRALVPTLDVMASSPLVRAQQTAEIVAACYGIGQVEDTPALAPGHGRRSSSAGRPRTSTPASWPSSGTNRT